MHQERKDPGCHCYLGSLCPQMFWELVQSKNLVCHQGCGGPIPIRHGIKISRVKLIKLAANCYEDNKKLDIYHNSISCLKLELKHPWLLNK